MGLISKLKSKKQVVFAFSDLVNDFIPYACHIDPETIATKNGELLQTIRIVGLSQDKMGSEVDDLRGIIRKAIGENIKSSDCALWIHTVRRKANLDPSRRYESTFAHDIHESWCEKNFWREKYINELYITILYKGEPFNLQDKMELIRSISFVAQRRHHDDLIKKALAKLNTTSEAILKTLAVFGAVKLKMVEHEDGYRCEIIEFFSKILHLHQSAIMAPIRDISECLASGKVAFGNNTFQVLHQGLKHFGAMFSIKEYHDFSYNLINQLLKTPQEYIVTQTLTFTSNQEALKQLENINYITSLSKDEEFREKSGLKRMIDNAKGGEADFCKQQLSLMIFGEDQQLLAQAITKMYESISKLGIAIIREDLLAEDLYWGQLPGNFNFVKRVSIISTNNIAGYASLHNSPSGNSSSIWGPPITIFRRNDSTPYFFNYHVGNVGHSMVVGSRSSAKNVLINFLLCETTKLSPRIFCLCGDRSSQITIKALGGKYCNLDAKSHLFNPLKIADTEVNREFLASWFSLIFDIEVNPEIVGIIDAIFKVDLSARNLRNFAQFTANQDLIKKIEPWAGNGEIGNLFCNENDLFDNIQNPVIGFDLSTILEKDEHFFLPIVMYLLFRFNMMLDGNPALFVLNNCDKLFTVNDFTEQLTDVLDYYTSRNCIAILSCLADEFDKNQFSDELLGKIVTKIFLPDRDLCEKYSSKLRLSLDQINKIKDLKVLYRNFLVLQGNENTICELNLDGIDYATEALAGTSKAITSMNQAIASTSDKVSDWLHPFYEKLF